VAAGPRWTGLARVGEGSAAGYAGDRDWPGLFISQGPGDELDHNKAKSAAAWAFPWAAGEVA
jgi:hypothetical protein